MKIKNIIYKYIWHKKNQKNVINNPNSDLN